MTKATKDAIEAVRVWCQKRGLVLIARPNHVFPRAYIVKKGHWKNIGGGDVPSLRIATPGIDAEPQMKKYGVHHPYTRVDGRDVDNSLKAGDWCICAYICERGHQRNVAVPLVDRGSNSGGRGRSLRRKPGKPTTRERNS